MCASPADRSDIGPGLTRRRMLRLAGTAGLAAASIGACSTHSVANPGPSPTSSSAASASPAASLLERPAAPAPNPASRVALCRDAWQAQPARGAGIPHVPNRMTIHHTAVVLGDNSNAPARLRQHQRYHQDSQGWIDIAYHYAVDRNGNIYQLRDPGLVGDTATSYDPTGHFLVVCEGDFDREAVTEEQLDGAAFVFSWAAQRYGIATNTLAGHRDASGDTACPGATLYAHVSSGELKRRVEEFLAAGTVSLMTVCGPEASAVVAEIASGQR